MNEKEDVEYWL